MQSLQIKTTQITAILLKIVRNHVRNNKSNKGDCYTLTAKIQFLKSRVLAQSYTNWSNSRIVYIVTWWSQRVKWRRKINDDNQRPKHKTKTCNHFKSKRCKSQQFCSKSSEIMSAIKIKQKGLLHTHKERGQVTSRSCFPPKLWQAQQLQLC